MYRVQEETQSDYAVTDLEVLGMKVLWMSILLNDPRAREVGRYFRHLKATEGTDGVMAKAQKMVNELAPHVAKWCPAIADSDPKRIGQFSKACVTGFILATADM